MTSVNIEEEKEEEEKTRRNKTITSFFKQECKEINYHTYPYIIFCESQLSFSVL